MKKTESFRYVFSMYSIFNAMNSVKLSGVFTVILLFISGFLFSQIPANINASGTWTTTTGSGSVTFAPGSCYAVTVQAWGGGGGGGGGNNGAASGGAGGGYAEATVSVVAGSTYFYSVGAGGTAGPTGVAGGNGGATWFNGTAGTNNNSSGAYINASGGNGGNGGNNIGGATQTIVGTGTFGTGLTGTVSHNGGTGGAGNYGDGSNGGGGGGGAGAGSGGNGGNGGSGGDGTSCSGACHVGAGGGGGGGGGASGAGTNGGNGSNTGSGDGGAGGAANGGGAGGAGGTGQNACFGGSATNAGNGVSIGGGGGGGAGKCGSGTTGTGGNGASGGGNIGGGGGGGSADGSAVGTGGAYGGGGGGGQDGMPGGVGGSGALTITVVMVATPTATASNTGPYCTDATIELSATGTGTYSWSGPNGFSSTQQNPTRAAAGNGGTYTVTVTAGSCTATASTTVVVNGSSTPTGATAAANPTALCPGGSLALTGNANGATSWSWTGPDGFTSTAQNPTIASVSAAGGGTYTLIASNACGSAAPATVNVSTSGLAFSETHQNINCFNDATGSIDITVNSGTPPYTYYWNPATAVGSNPTNLLSGTYGLTITDNAGCSATGTIILTQPTTALTAITSHTDVTCNGFNNGTFTINITGGTAPYNYAGNPIPAGTTTIGNLAPNTYGGVVTDNNGCTTTVSETITEPGPQSLTLTQTDATCYGGRDGTVTANFVNATGTVTYNWSPGGVQSGSRTGLAAGTYSVTATDANGCSFAGTTTVGQPAVVTMPVATTDAVCFGQNGSASASPAGTTAPVIYVWSYAAAGNGPNASLPAGTYTVTSTDAAYCQQTATLTVNQPADLQISSSTTDATCNGGTDGAINLTVTGGTGGYTYVWTPNVSSSSSASNLSAGSYVISVTDGNACAKSVTLTISQQSAIVIASQVTDVLCNGDANGTVQLSATGGAGNYILELQINGTYTSATNDLFSNLPAGVYAARATDGAGCQTVTSVTVTEPAPFQLALLSNDSAKCYGESTGRIRAQASGGTFPYTYSYNGSSNTTGIFSNVPAGVHSVVVTDVNGCSATLSTVIYQPEEVLLYIDPTDTIVLNIGETQVVTVSSNYTDAVFHWAPSIGLACTDCSQNTISTYNNITYTITATTSPYGSPCVATVRLPVTVVPNYQLYVPNAFSPNGDFANDYFEIFGNKAGIKFLEFRVFNRWGEKVYETNDTNFKWDGKFKGVPLNQGTYVYTMTVVFLDNHEETKYKGSITILR